MKVSEIDSATGEARDITLEQYEQQFHTNIKEEPNIQEGYGVSIKDMNFDKTYARYNIIVNRLIHSTPRFLTGYVAGEKIYNNIGSVSPVFDAYYKSMKSKFGYYDSTIDFEKPKYDNIYEELRTKNINTNVIDDEDVLKVEEYEYELFEEDYEVKNVSISKPTEFQIGREEINERMKTGNYMMTKTNTIPIITPAGKVEEKPIEHLDTLTNNPVIREVFNENGDPNSYVNYESTLRPKFMMKSMKGASQSGSIGGIENEGNIKSGIEIQHYSNILLNEAERERMVNLGYGITNNLNIDFAINNEKDCKECFYGFNIN